MSSHSSGSSGGGGVGGRLSRAWPKPNSGALTPKNLLKRYKDQFPLAAHLHTPTAPPGLDLSRPLLLYNHYTSTKVRGVSLRPGKNSGDLVPIGPAIVIPASYTGWFAVVTSDGHTAPYYSTIEQVANSQVSFFLTRYDVPAFTNKQDDNGRMSYQKTVVQSGHVLKLLGIYEDLNARRTNSGGRSRDIVGLTNDKYAQCLNYKNEVVFVSFSASGRFYTTAHKSSKNPNHVYLMTHILKNHRLPITVRLVCGYMPRVPCNFTGVLRLEQSQKEAVMLACTMTNEAQATLFEIDVSSNFVLTPVKDPMFPKRPIFLKTVSYCQDEADAWRRQIKVTHHVTERRSKSMSRMVCDRLLDQPKPVTFALLADHGRRRVSRGREKSRDRFAGLILGEKIRDKPKENLPRDRSKEVLRRYRSRDRILDVHKGKLEDTDGKLKGNLSSNKLDEKGHDNRKVSKQNTYIFQNGRSTKIKEKRQEADALKRLNRSIENLDYSRVADDISPPREDEEDADNHYAEICDYITDKQEKSVDKSREKRKSLSDHENSHSKFNSDMSQNDNNLSFTLLKKDIGGYYVKIPGFELPKSDFELSVNSDHNRSYDSLC